MRLLLFNLATDADDPILGFTTRWTQALAKRVASVDVITMRAGRIEVPGNVQVYSVGKEKGYSEPRRILEFYRHLFRILRERRIDVCFSHMIPEFTILAAPVLKAKGVPIVTWYAHPALTWKLKLAHYLSDRMVASLAKAYPYKQDKLTVVGQGIDTDLFAPDGMPPEEPPIILCAGRLSPVKDHPTLLKAAALLRDRWGQLFRVVIVGGPAGAAGEAYARSLRDLAQELGLQDIVHFEPPVPMTALPPWYRRCTLQVNLTPTGSGDKVVLEVMSCGRPCLVANEGFRETLGEYADRLLFRCGDPEDLAAKLQRLLQMEKAELVWMGNYLRNNVIRFHSLEGLAERLTEIFKQLSACRKATS
ncbi:MAG: glycosyltransferase family 4 protein [Bacillota bacterium]|jgi:glycosyltransferase involved in cell wall biosynthesis|nr:glycosyltransferase family 4 protein [Thermoanaerobacteraceae bacterium]